MANDREERIRKRAHEIWDAEGRPHGRHEEHWQKAMKEVGGGDPEAAQMGSMREASSDPSQPGARRRKAAAGGEAAPKARTPRASKGVGQGSQPDATPPAAKGRRSAAAAQGGEAAASPGRARRSGKSAQAE